MKMETTTGIYGKGNETTSWCSLYVGLCFVLNGNYRCMRCRCQNTLYQICTNQIDNGNVH